MLRNLQAFLKKKIVLENFLDLVKIYFFDSQIVTKIFGKLFPKIKL